jgi:hypothetical protein
MGESIHLGKLDIKDMTVLSVMEHAFSVPKGDNSLLM